MKGIIRLATPADANKLAALYKYYVTETVVSLELEPPSIEEFRRRIETIGQFFPYLVHSDGGDLTGYAYASKFHERGGYRYDVTTSVYLARSHQGKGLGKKLYAKLFSILEAQGVKNAYAVITCPNEKSVGLHSACGFERLGYFPHSGYKHDRWVDVLYMGKHFDPMPQKPGPLISIGEIQKEFIARILED